MNKYYNYILLDNKKFLEKLLYFYIFNIYNKLKLFFIKMLTSESQYNFEHQLDKCNSKNYYLTTISNLATSGNYYRLIKFIENTIPNVSL